MRHEEFRIIFFFHFFVTCIFQRDTTHFSHVFLRPSPFFFRLASNAFPDVGSVCRIEKKNHIKSRNRRPWYPRMTLKVNIHIFGLTKYTAQYTVKNVPVFVYAATTLIFQLKRIQVKNGLTISLLFFFENAKNLGRSDDAKRRKKRMAL